MFKIKMKYTRIQEWLISDCSSMILLKFVMHRQICHWSKMDDLGILSSEIWFVELLVFFKCLVKCYVALQCDFIVIYNKKVFTLNCKYAFAWFLYSLDVNFRDWEDVYRNLEFRFDS